LKSVILFLTISISFNLFSFETPKTDRIKISIVDFSANPTPGADMASMIDVQTVTNSINEEIQSILMVDYEIASQQELKQALKLNDLPQLGIIGDRDALIKMGLSISAVNVIMGSVSKSGELFLVDIKCINTKNGIEKYGQFKIDNISDLEDAKFKNSLKRSLEKLSKMKPVEKVVPKEVAVKKEVKKDDPKEFTKKQLKKQVAFENIEIIRPYKLHALGAGTASIVSLAAGIVFHMKKSDKKDQHDSKLKEWNPDWNQSEISLFKYQESSIRDDGNKYDTYSNVFYISSGILAVTSGVLYFITEQKKQQKNLSFDVGFDSDFVMLNLNIKY